MKKFWVLLIIVLVLIFANGCPINTHQNYSGLYIASINTYKPSEYMIKSVRAGGPIVKDLYCYGYPVNNAYFGLVPVDSNGNVIESDTVQWSLDDPSIGILKPDFISTYARILEPARAGETIVRATDGIYTDEAKIVVFPCAQMGPYWSLDLGQIVNDSMLADIQWVNTDFVFLSPYAIINKFQCLDELYALTGNEAILQSPPLKIPVQPVLLLMQSHSGAIYGVLLEGGNIAWKLITPAPSPSP